MSNLETSFEKLLHLQAPIFVKDVIIDDKEHKVDVNLDIPRYSKFDCPICGKKSLKIHDRLPKIWRHLNIYEFESYIHFKVPRITCPNCGTHMISVPWARPNCGFTLLFELSVLKLAKDMSIAELSIFIGETDNIIWRIIKHYVDEYRQQIDWSKIKYIGVDETSSRKGHNYITTVIDMENHIVLFATEGKDASTIKSFADEAPKHRLDINNITEVCTDMSKAFIAGVTNYLPNASLTYDKFHVIKHLNEALDDVRRNETKKNPILKGSKYLWLKNPLNLTIQEQQNLKTISKENLRTSKAYQMKLTFQDIYKRVLDKDSAVFAIKKWLTWSCRSRLDSIIAFGRMVKTHFEGVTRYWNSGLTNGAVEGINSQIQEVKRRARGFKNINNFITMVYLVCGGIF